MSVLLRWLVEYAWVFYIGCAIGALVYLVRALGAQRERSLALFTLEHETATVRAVRAWATVFAFTAIALVVFISVTFMVNHIPAYNSDSPMPTSTPRSGVQPATVTVVPTLTEPAAVPTVVAGTGTPLAPTQPPDPTEPPAPAATDTATPPPIPTGALSGDLDVRFGDFGRLAGYEISASQVSPGQSLAVTLYWQGLEGTSPVDYTVFTHLISEDGRLIAQHDGPPASGTVPTTSWQAGRAIQDRHQLAFRAEGSDYEGPATVMVGLYDPANPDARLVNSTGRDYVRLPVTISVVQP